MMQEWILYFERTIARLYKEKWCGRGEFGVELCTSCWESLILMGVTVLLSLRRQIKKKRPILSLKRRPCCGIKDWDILEKRAFEHYMVKVWLKVCLIALWILIFVNIAIW
jgi:hypothetical protein